MDRPLCDQPQPLPTPHFPFQIQISKNIYYVTIITQHCAKKHIYFQLFLSSGVLHRWPGFSKRPHAPGNPRGPGKLRLSPTGRSPGYGQSSGLPPTTGHLSRFSRTSFRLYRRLRMANGPRRKRRKSAAIQNAGACFVDFTPIRTWLCCEECASSPMTVKSKMRGVWVCLW